MWTVDITLWSVFVFLSVVIVIIVFDNSQSFGHGFHRIDNFFLDQIERHGQKCDTKEQVKGAKSNADLDVFFDVLRWNKVAKTDCGQCNETKISRVEEGPLLPSAKEEGTTKDVTNHQ